MNKKLIYIIGSICIVALLLLVFLRPRENTFDKRIILDENYKIPYGLYIAHSLLPKLFAGSTMEENSKSPTYWYNADSSAKGKSIFFLISEQFNPERWELKRLLSFVKDGNQVFICTPEMNETAKEYFGFGEEYTDNDTDSRGSGYENDSGHTSLLKPPFMADTAYFNPGYHVTTHFIGTDSLHYTVLGRSDAGQADFIKVSAGKGAFYFHSNPLLFSNYFLLYRNNLDYFQKVVSLMPPDKKKIIWDSYYIYHRNDNGRNSDPSPLRVLWKVTPFRWAFVIALILLALYIALGAKRLQRIVPLFAKPQNDTLEFAKTIGRLYFEKGDNTNLAQKMATYLLEYIRNRYFIKTAELDADFIKNLSSKTGYDEESTKQLVGNLVYIQDGHLVTEKQLAEIYASFSKFYKYTA